MIITSSDNAWAMQKFDIHVLLFLTLLGSLLFLFELDFFNFFKKLLYLENIFFSVFQVFVVSTIDLQSK